MRPRIILLGTAALLPSISPIVGVQPNLASELVPAPTEAVVAATESTVIPKRANSAVALVIFGNDTVRAEVANTSALRSRGLMDREEVPSGTGMLFVWENEAIRSFWMRNTLVALDVAFIDQNFEVVDILQMEPETTETHDGAKPAMYALEVHHGWFAENDITVGDLCEVIFSE